jgi:hypothetical protein
MVSALALAVLVERGTKHMTTGGPKFVGAVGCKGVRCSGRAGKRGGRRGTSGGRERRVARPDTAQPGFSIVNYLLGH